MKTIFKLIILSLLVVPGVSVAQENSLSEVQKQELIKSLLAQIQVLQERLRVELEKRESAGSLNEEDATYLLLGQKEEIFYVEDGILYARYEDGDTRNERERKLEKDAVSVPKIYEDLWQRFKSMDGVANTIDFVRFYDGSSRDDQAHIGFGYDGRTYVLSINLDGYAPDNLDSEKKMIESFVKGVSQLVTLSRSQTSSSSQKKCENLYINYWKVCSDDNSYLTLYSDEYWSGDIMNDYLDGLRRYSGESEDEFIKDFYANNKDMFFSLEGAGNISEDIVEAMTNFVLTDKPYGFETIKEQKIDFFYGFPDMVRLRDKIRSQINSNYLK